MTPPRRLPPAPYTAILGTLAALLVTLLLTNHALAATATAQSDSVSGDDLGYLKRLAVRAETGDDTAAFLLGVTLASGRAGVRDDSAALRWFQQAAGAGLPAAQYNLGLMLAAGRGAERDYAEALRWYEAAGEQDMAPAQFNAAMMLLDGAPGVPTDVSRAVGWLRRSAELGLAPAEFNLGVLREFGRGMPRDVNAAAAWYQRALRQGYQPARERLARLHGGEVPAQAEPTGNPPAVAPATVRAVARPVPDTRPTEPNGWVMQRDPARFTLQLFSTRDEQYVRDYLARHELGDQGGYFRTAKDGKRWYSVVYGDFDSYAAAEQASREPRREIGSSKPWIRNFGVIQEALEP